MDVATTCNGGCGDGASICKGGCCVVCVTGKDGEGVGGAGDTVGGAGDLVVRAGDAFLGGSTCGELLARAGVAVNSSLARCLPSSTLPESCADRELEEASVDRLFLRRFMNLRN